jgi:hypothetical protein
MPRKIAADKVRTEFFGFVRERAAFRRRHHRVGDQPR